MCTCNRAAPPPEREILPTHLKPLHYDLTFHPDFETFKFKGKAVIDLKIQDSSVHYVELNTLELFDFEATVGKDHVKPLKIESIKETQRTRFHFPAELFTSTDDVLRLNVNYNGILNDNMAGFYRSKYKDALTGEEKYMVSTQFEATDARRAFPCFDEPNLKAKFTITLISDKKFVQLSNMDVASEVIENDLKTTKFNTTPLMSTYLVAFVIGEFVGVPSKYEYRIPVTTWTIPGTEKSAQYSADFTAKCLEFFEKTFDIKYPLPKMDSALIKEFSAGAMENYGLITYRDTALMLDLENSTLDEQIRVSEVVAHEVSHQWFGNLATMDWWSCLYLNESGATFWSWFCCNHFKPEWKVWEHFVTDSLQAALTLDGLRSSHQVEVDVNKADEINQIFDAISYSKGGSLLRMMANWLGEETFVQGVANYLREFSYKNAVTEDLWNHLGKQSGKPVPEIMSVWTKKVGYPIVTVEESGDKTLKLTQHRFLKTGDVKPEDDTTIYPIIPFLKTAADKIDKDTVLYERENTLEIPNSDFYKINGNQAGFFLTCYPESRYAKLGTQAHLLSVEDRAGLIGELESISAAGHTSTSNFLGLLRNWKSESSPAVWGQMLSSLAAVKTAWLFEDDKTTTALRKFTADLISDKLNELGWEIKESDDFELKSLKISLFSSSVNAKVDKYIQIGLDQFAKYAQGDSSAIDPLHKDIVFNAVAVDGKAENFDKLLAIYKKNDKDKINALKALSRFENDEIIPKIISFLLDESVIAPQDIYIPMANMRTSKKGVLALWDWIQSNWSEIEKRFPPSLNMLSYIVKISTSGFTSTDRIGEIEEFFSTKNCSGFDRALAQSIDSIKSKAQWVERDAPVVADFLKEHKYL